MAREKTLREKILGLLWYNHLPTLKEVLLDLESNTGTKNFTSLEDTPQSYEGQSGKILKVNSEESGLEFADESGDSGNFIPLTGTATGNPVSGDIESVSEMSIYGVHIEKEIDNPNLSAYGNVINDNFLGGSLSGDYSTTLTPTTEYTVASGLNIISAAADFTKYIQIEKYISETRWKQSIKFVVNTLTSTTYGLGLGIESTNSFTANKSSMLAQIFLHSDPTLKGKIAFYGASALPIISQSSTALDFSIGDEIQFDLVRVDNVFTATAINITTGTNLTFSYTYTVASAALPLIPNTGKFRIYAFSGSYKIENYTYSNNAFVGGVAFIGDSITNGYLTPQFSDAWVNKLGNFSRNWDIFGGQGDRVQDLLLSLPDIVSQNAPSKAVIFLGTNDGIQGIPVNTYKSNLNSMITSLQAIGTDVYIITCAPSTVNMTAYADAAIEVANSHSLPYIDAFRLWKSDVNTGWNDVYFIDNVHPNSIGHNLLAKNVINIFPAILDYGLGKLEVVNMSPPITPTFAVVVDDEGRFYKSQNTKFTDFINTQDKIATEEWVGQYYRKISAANNFVNDVAAAAGGVAIGNLYHTAGVVKIRLT